MDKKGEGLQVWSQFGANLAPTWRPKRLPNRGQKPKKSMLKNNTFLASIFKGFGCRFGVVFGRFFWTKMHGNSKNTILAKTLKIVLPSSRNANFQEIEDRKNEKHHTKIDEILHRTHYEKSVKIMDLGLSKPSQNWPKMVLKTRFQKTSNFSIHFCYFWSFFVSSISWKLAFRLDGSTIFTPRKSPEGDRRGSQHKSARAHWNLS